MSEQRPFLIRTGFLGGLLILTFLVTLPTLVQHGSLKSALTTAEPYLNEFYEQFDLPPITYTKQEARCNNDMPYTKRYTIENEVFLFHIDTSENPDTSVVQNLDSDVVLAVVLYRDRLSYSGTQQSRSKSETIYFRDFPSSDTIIIDKQFLKDITAKFIQYFFLGMIGFLAVYHCLGKLITWGILSAALSGKLKPLGGGHNRLAMWCLVPPTILQSFFAAIHFPWFFGFILYFVVLVLTAIFLKKRVLHSLEQAVDE